MMVDRIRRPAHFEDLMKKLSSSDISPLLSYKDVLVFAACVGYSRRRRLAFDKSGEKISLTVFSGHYDLMVINSIAIAETNDPFILGSEKEEEKYKIFEEYACGGLEVLENEIANSGSNFLDAFVNLVMTEKNSGDSILDNLEALTF
jgi:dnd system-associated protein 4